MDEWHYEVRLDWKPEIRGLNEEGRGDSAHLGGEALHIMPAADVFDDRIRMHNVEVIIPVFGQVARVSFDMTEYLIIVTISLQIFRQVEDRYMYIVGLKKAYRQQIPVVLSTACVEELDGAFLLMSASYKFDQRPHSPCAHSRPE